MREIDRRLKEIEKPLHRKKFTEKSISLSEMLKGNIPEDYDPYEGLSEETRIRLMKHREEVEKEIEKLEGLYDEYLSPQPGKEHININADSE